MHPTFNNREYNEDDLAGKWFIPSNLPFYIYFLIDEVR